MMGSSSRFSVKAREPRWVQDWADAEAVERVEVDENKVASLPLRRGRVETELAERIEAIEAQVAILDAERTALETEFVTRVDGIEAQVESLDIEREWLEAGLSVAESWGPSALKLPHKAENEEQGEPTPIVWSQPAPIHWPTFALLVLLVLGPWILIGALVSLAWLLLG
jgi:hypothetical protein